ncbi:hypothetical protein V8B97DRAFT_2024735 [Scleroderma yunnanense]
MNIICTGLKLAPHTSTFMSNPNNLTHYCFTPLTAYIINLPKQLMITCITKSVSPISMAVKTQFGNTTSYLWLLAEAKKQHLSSELLEHNKIDTCYCMTIMTLQHTIIATIVGLAELDFIHAIHTIVDFLYQAQVPTFTSFSNHVMEEPLQEFHTYKGSIIAIGVQSQKLRLLQSFSHSICNVSFLIQYSADVSEYLLITHCKDPFIDTNHQRSSFIKQIMLLLDHEEFICQFGLYSLQKKRNVNFTNILPSQFNNPCYVDPTHAASEDDSTTTFHVTVKPDFADNLPNHVVTTYNLTDFLTLL